MPKQCATATLDTSFAWFVICRRRFLLLLGLESALKILLRKKTKKQLRDPTVDVNAEDEFGYTALHNAVTLGEGVLVRIFSKYYY